MSDFHKHQRKQQNSNRLSKLAYYCQICQKQCRDDNGYRQHLRSPHHLKMKSKVTPQDIAQYNDLFEKSFLQYLRLSHGEKWVNANKVYNAFIINDKDHVHMNSTKWSSLTKFVQHLGKQGKVRVQVEDQNEEANFDTGMEDNDAVNSNSLLIAYVDRSSETLLRKAQVEQMERDNLTEQESRTLLLQKQMDNAKKLMEEEEAEEDASEETRPVEPLSKISLVTSNRVGKPKVKKPARKKKNVFE